MTNLSELKSAFYREHARDRKFTLLNYFLILCLIAAFIGFLAFLGVNFKELISAFIEQNADSVESKSFTSLYPIIATIVAFSITFGYPFFLIWKISKRPRKIEELIERATAGAKLSSVNDYVEHKITLPLAKVKLKLCPVTFVQLFIEGDLKPYILPLHPSFIADMKILFSGVNVEEIKKHKSDLYNNTNDNTKIVEAEENFVTTPIKTVAEFRTFIDKELKEDIEGLEASRKSSYKGMIIGGVFSGIAVVAVMGFICYKAFTNQGEFSVMTSILPIFVLAIVISIIMNIVMKKKYKNTQETVGQEISFGNKSFKEKIITKMIEFVNPTVKYIPLAHLGLDDIFESGLFEQRNYMVSGSDMISGRHNGVPFITSDLTLQFKRNFSEENEQPDTVFYGQFFVARFNKKFNMPVYVISTERGADTRSYLENNMGEQVKLEDPEFMKMFKVYAHDQVEARYILTPSLMERLKELAKRTKGAYYVAFYQNKITVANNSGINNFEVGYSKSLTSKDNELLVNFYTDLCNQFAVIDELKLNINIWKKS